MNFFSVPGKAVVALLVAGSLCACAAPAKKDESTQPSSQPTYKPTGSHIVERSDGRRSPKNSSTAPVKDLEDAPAVTVIQNQPPK
jgi:hypothetical protein